MTEEKDEFQENMAELFKKAKSFIQAICQDKDADRRLKHNLCVALIGSMITEAGIELYPYFSKGELHLFLGHLERCIDDVCQEQQPTEEDELNLSKFVTECAEKIMAE